MAKPITNDIPPLDEFIDVEKRRREAREAQGFDALRNRATVAVYDTNTPNRYQILTVRIADDLASKHRLTEGLRLLCHIHPDQRHIALRPGGGKRQGSTLFRPKGSKSLVYQTTLKEGMLSPQGAQAATITDTNDGAVIVSLT